MSLIIILRNITNLAEVSDYAADVLVGDGTPERSVTLYRGEVKEHKRADGWKPLVQKLLDQVKP